MRLRVCICCEQIMTIEIIKVMLAVFTYKVRSQPKKNFGAKLKIAFLNLGF